MAADWTYYANKQSDLQKAQKGKLLLMVGGWIRTWTCFQHAGGQRFIKPNKGFELLVVPELGHGVSGSPYGRRGWKTFWSAICPPVSRAGKS